MIARIKFDERYKIFNVTIFYYSAVYEKIWCERLSIDGKHYNGDEFKIMIVDVRMLKKVEYECVIITKGGD
jgi:hypothetical protein